MLKRIIHLLIRCTGIPYFVREVIQKKYVTILLFHNISVSKARESFFFLKKRYNIISLQKFIKACKDRNSDLIPDKALIITFDDGYKDNYELLPLIKELNIPITIFLCTGVIGTNRNFWFEYLEDPQLIQKLKSFTNKDRLDFLLKKGFEQDKEFDRRQALSEEEIEKMKEHVDFQAHTLYHPCLPQCNSQESRREIMKSKEVLEEKFNLDINTISYPNGDYTDREVRFSKESGYKAGITVDGGYNSIDSNLFQLKRLSVNDAGNLNELSVKSTGVWVFLKGWFNNLLSIFVL